MLLQMALISRTGQNFNLVPRVSLLCLHCRFSTTMEAEKRDPGNEVDITFGTNICHYYIDCVETLDAVYICL